MSNEIKTPKYSLDDPRNVLGRMEPSKRELVKELQRQATAERISLKRAFEDGLTPEKRKQIADSFLFAVTNGTVKIGDRLKILELILKLTGELQTSITKGEITAENITLIID